MKTRTDSCTARAGRWVRALGALAMPATLACAAADLADAPAPARIQAGFIPGSARFAFEHVPLPAANDAAAGARFRIVDGATDPNSAAPEALGDGRVPANADQPPRNFFFRAGSDGGRLLLDLGRGVAVAAVNTYSWHAGTRGPQVYTLYGADGQAAGFAAEPRRGQDPQACGWARLAEVDTRPAQGDGGGQHGVSVSAPTGALGTFRYLLFDMRPTERRDAFGNTFYSEIDVIAAGGPPPAHDAWLLAKPVRLEFASPDGAYRFAVDATEAPDLAEWTGRTLQPVVAAWYPRIAALLASEGHQPRREVTLVFRTDMGGTPASAAGSDVNLNAVWFRQELAREAAGAVVHELVHVVQDYWRAGGRGGGRRATPGWIVEGIADYVRWFLYEPQSRGAEITRRNVAGARYDASYRVSANFLDWATRTCDTGLVTKLNAAAREGRYEDALWREWTGKSIEELGEAWLTAHRRRLE